MRIILFGATGMVGAGTLREALADPDVQAVLSVSRRSCGEQHPKLRELLLPDLFEFAAAEPQLAGWDACSVSGPLLPWPPLPSGWDGRCCAWSRARPAATSSNPPTSIALDAGHYDIAQVSQGRTYRAGGSVEDHCRACKTDRFHTVIVVDAAGQPLRVACDYCRSEHNYRGGARITDGSARGRPGGSSRPSIRSRTVSPGQRPGEDCAPHVFHLRRSRAAAAAHHPRGSRPDAGGARGQVARRHAGAAPGRRGHSNRRAGRSRPSSTRS